MKEGEKDDRVVGKLSSTVPKLQEEVQVVGVQVR